MWLRRIAGAAWLAAGVATVVFLLDLWSRLGGTVDERLRWWARLGLLAGPVVGYFAGLQAREMAGWGSGRSHATLLRLFWIPPGLVTVVYGVTTTFAGAHDEARVALGSFLAYWAGFDAAIGAWPLLRGRPYRFLRDIPPEEIGEPEP